MTFQKFKIQENGSITANGADSHGTFIVRGQVKPELTFSAMKMYPDHCVFLWGNAGIDENKLAMSDWNSPPPLEEVDSFEGEWGFEEGTKEGNYGI